MIYMIFGLMLATLGVLVVGLVVMARGGAINEKYANRLMVWRVTLQSIAIALLGFMFLLK